MKSSLFIIISFILLFINVKADNNDRKWMSLLPEDLKLNKLNIPGTHDSGTFRVTTAVSAFAQTQNLSIKEQLENGIRYLDLRLSDDEESSDRNIYNSHDSIVCWESFWSWKKLHLNKVLDYCVEFLLTQESKDETIILHLKQENRPEKMQAKEFTNKVGNVIFDKKYQNYIYNSTTIPLHKDVKCKIYIVTRSNFVMEDDSGKNNQNFGCKIEISEMGGCYFYNKADPLGLNSGDICRQVVIGDIHVQDAYNLRENNKWYMVKDVLTGEIDCRSKD
ncbi:PLC-like phosphodiesterase [Neocallimastix lanati (nom. inval.)]|uniref:PLC-like phosphodiesterase n=1 Tax=Neocallimastix californiae TaxID=1754190 RepID=A0A1Y1YU16_9FUNG|nr:PLC-like phosphodiesterase [Neocallimastix sp. JGI-2020a]ORY01324.1 PLC-like phosphodiesterase [Neocallimastix californiae]|eukprot:ORY01324.1 PLC-like phosphodiesterase [Neocallimastix californiae]